MVLISATLMPSLLCRKKMMAGSMSPGGSPSPGLPAGQAHGGVDGLAVLDGADGAAVAQAAVDDVQLGNRLCSLLGRFQADVVVAGAVGARSDGCPFSPELAMAGRARKASSGMVW